MIKRPEEPNKEWESTQQQNLVRHVPSGTFYARFKVGKRKIRVSLNTQVFTVAKQRLPEKIREYRTQSAVIKKHAGGKMTFGDAAKVYLNKVQANPSLKPRTKDYYEMLLE
jgi:hypothetical protein